MTTNTALLIANLILTACVGAIVVVLILRNRKDIREVMTTTASIEEKIQQLNEAIGAETAQQAAAMKNLRDEIANGADAESLTRIADELDASIARVKGIVPDAPVEKPAEGAAV